MKAVSVAGIAGIFGCTMIWLATAAEAATYSEKVVYSFCSQADCTDGDLPFGSLVNVKGRLYGTTISDGANRNGTVFSFDPGSGAETTIYSFCGEQRCSDGGQPGAGLLNVKGTLYGTTETGGSCSEGTVFSVDPDIGDETVLHSFCSGGSDGVRPVAGLIIVKGKLYGTTMDGGSMSCSCGTVFSIDPSTGIETVLHSFGDRTDGQSPHVGLIAVNGKLYGTTSNGGMYAQGTLFTIDAKTGAEAVVHSFCSFGECRDGANPGASLIAVNGVLYGTTGAGGNTGCPGGGCGTVFAFDQQTRAFTVLHQFKPGGDGAYPAAGLISVKTELYGTTYEGGATGEGTVFSLDPGNGAETVVYSFCSQLNCTDGEQPYSGLVAVKGVLYGTTIYGGNSTNCYHGCGSVFALTKEHQANMRSLAVHEHGL